MTSQHEERRDHGVAGVLMRLQGEVPELSQKLWAARTPDELMQSVAAIEALKSSLDALELGIVSGLDATHGVKPVGWASNQDFATAVAGGHQGTGPAMVRLTKAVESPHD